MATNVLPKPAIRRGGTEAESGKTTLRVGVGRVQLVSELRLTWDHRASIAFIDVPLAMTATALLGLWWAWIPLAAIAALAWRGWRWSALLAVNQGLVGWCWAYVGVTWLGVYPHNRAVVAIAWIGFAAALAVARWMNIGAS